MSGVFVGLTVLTLLGTVAPRLRWLHQLPPPLGAPRPPKEVKFGLEDHDGLTIQMASSARQGVIMRITIPPEGRPDEIPRVLVNAYVVGATHIIRALPSGATYRDGGVAGKGRTGRTGRSQASRFRSGRTKCSSRSQSRGRAPTRPY